MKNLAFAVFCFFFISGAIAHAESKINVICSMIETPSSEHDGWIIAFQDQKLSYFNNDTLQYANFLDVESDQITGEGPFQVYQSVENDGFSVRTTDPQSLYGKNPFKKIYAELFFKNDARPRIFECVKSTAEELKDFFKYQS